ncbi:MAG TPA: hypothetical protein VMR74_14305 [Gammaproteobacteria bacterium]|nr:hypothetical protein [Gammaproteobacteria bacterium]
MSQISTPTAPGNGSTTDRLASMAHESIDRVTPKANRAETEVRDTVARTAEGVKHLEEQALDTAKDGLHKAQAYIDRNPLMAAGIAFGAGVLLSMLIRR